MKNQKSCLRGGSCLRIENGEPESFSSRVQIELRMKSLFALGINCQTHFAKVEITNSKQEITND